MSGFQIPSGGQIPTVDRPPDLTTHSAGDGSYRLSGTPEDYGHDTPRQQVMEDEVVFDVVTLTA